MFASSVRICGVGCSAYLYDCVLSFRKSVRLSIPSSCGMFVYSEDMSIDASMQFDGNFSLSIVLIKEVESCMYDGSGFTYGCSQWSTSADMFSVILPQLDTIGLMPGGFLWNFFRKYSLEVLWVSGG